VLRRGNPNWHAVVYEVPTDPQTLYTHLDGRAFTVLGRREEDQKLDKLEGAQPFAEYQRLIFVIKR
jgi:hypothetical protein